jgi:hypothetical protein
MKIEENIIGAWALSSFEMVSQDGFICHPLGEQAKGALYYLPDGHVSVHIMQPDRQEVIDLNLFTKPEFKYNELAYLAYCGRYYFDPAEQLMTHELDISLYPEWVGGKQLRKLELNGDQLQLSSVSSAEPKQMQFRLIWHRA